MFVRALERFDRIDTLPNNVGVAISKPLVEYAKFDFSATAAVNLAGRREAARILNANSVAACIMYVGHLLEGVHSLRLPERLQPTQT